ncbi:hypothetical protein D1007_17875 [Hordeum vulgare]|nr:hypothetical protein D1007_17875 [Hordeum vulgare]
MDAEGKDKHAENMIIEGMITKDEDVNHGSSKRIEQQAIMDDTENIHINEENMDEEGKDKHAENIVIEGMITKDEDVNPESSKRIEQQAIMDDTENIHINKELTRQGTSEQKQPTQDIELAQMFDTEWGETIGDNLADSNVRAGKDEEEKKKSTQSTHSEELTDNETSKPMEACGDEELEQTSGRERAEIIGDKLPMGAQTWKPIRLHNKPKKAQHYVVAPEGTVKSFYALVLLHLFSSLLINVITSIMIDYACTGDDWNVIENIMSKPNDKRTLVSIDDSNLQRRQLERLLLPGEFLGDEIIDAYIHCISAKEHLKMRTGGSVFLENACISKLIKEFKFIRDDTLRWVLDRATTYLEHDMIYVPLNIKDFHWYLAVINSRVRHIQVLDSLGPGMNCKDPTAMERMGEKL